MINIIAHMRYLLAIKMFLITRAAFATSLSFNSESGRTFRIICQVFITKQKDPSIISDAKILIGHLNLMTLLPHVFWDFVTRKVIKIFLAKIIKSIIIKKRRDK